MRQMHTDATFTRLENKVFCKNSAECVKKLIAELPRPEGPPSHISKKIEIQELIFSWLSLLAEYCSWARTHDHDGVA